MSVTVLVPSIPPRQEMLARALASVANQKRNADEILVRVAHDRMPAPQQRDALLAKVTTDWVAPLDDDDEFYPFHLQVLLGEALKSHADLVYPWFDVVGGVDPFPQWEGAPWENDEPHQVPITALFRTEAVRAVGGWAKAWDVDDPEDPGTDEHGNRAGEDYALVKRMALAGMTIVHLPIRSWKWFHHGANTMGLPSRW